MSLQFSISQQLHNTIANKQTSTQKDFVTYKLIDIFISPQGQPQTQLKL